MRIPGVLHWPSFAAQSRPLPIFPNVSIVNKRTAREIMHAMLTSRNRIRFDPCEGFAWPVSFSAWFLFSFCSTNSTGVGLSSSKLLFIKCAPADKHISNRLQEENPITDDRSFSSELPTVVKVERGRTVLKNFTLIMLQISKQQKVVCLWFQFFYVLRFIQSLWLGRSRQLRRAIKQ